MKGCLYACVRMTNLTCNIGQPSNTIYLVANLASGGVNYMYRHEVYNCREAKHQRQFARYVVFLGIQYIKLALSESKNIFSVT